MIAQQVIILAPQLLLARLVEQVDFQPLGYLVVALVRQALTLASKEQRHASAAAPVTTRLPRLL
jgi:hypothetical protein